MAVITCNPMETTLFELWLKQIQRASEDPEWWQWMLGTKHDADTSAKEWLNRWKSILTGTGNPAEIQKVQDDWFRMMGVVPRQRYLDLLEKCDALQRQLETTEHALKAATAAMSPESEKGSKAQMVDAWQQMATQTLALQQAWLKGIDGLTVPSDQQKSDLS